MKEDKRIRDARIQEDILKRCIINVNIDYNEIANNYNVSKECIFEKIRVLEYEEFVKVHFPEYGSPDLTKITFKGKSYEEYELVKNAKNEVQGEEKNENRAERQHKLNGYNIWLFWIGIFGISYTIIDILSKSILEKGILDILF